MNKTLRLSIALLLLSSVFGRTASYAQGVIPTPAHVIVIFEENRAQDEIIGNTTNAPYINALAVDPFSALFTGSEATAHPSQPNYLQFFSSSNQGILDDGDVNTECGGCLPYTYCNLGGQLISSGHTFATYSQSMPSVGYQGDQVTDGAGQYYYRKHNPCANWDSSMATSGTSPMWIAPRFNMPFYGYFPDSAHYSSLPTVAFVVPNGTDDMHDNTSGVGIDSGDTWLKNNMASLIHWAYYNNTLVIVTFDEDDESTTNNSITTIFYGPMVQGGSYNNVFNHYSVLQTIEDMYSLGSCGATVGNSDTVSITNCWKTASSLGVNNVAGANSNVTVTPNPASNNITFNCNEPLQATISIMDVKGNLVGKYSMNGTSLLVNTAAFARGLYTYKVENNNNQITDNGKFIISHN